MKKDPTISTLAVSALTGGTLFLGFYIFAVAFKRKQIPIESVAGAIIFGIFILLYLGWFVLDTYVNEADLDWRQALTFNLKSNPAFWAAYCFFLVFGYAVLDAVF